MPKKLDLTDNLEQYIIDNSEPLTKVQKEIIEYNITLEIRRDYKYQFLKLNYYNH